MKIIVDPRFRYNYASYYLLGLSHLGTVKMDVRPFMDIPQESGNHGVAFVLEDKGVGKKIRVFIDYWDFAAVDDGYYEWTDVYAKDNPSKELLRNYSKMIASGPMFGLKLHSLSKSILLACKNYLLVRNNMKCTFTSYLRDYVYSVLRRNYLVEYQSDYNNVKANYIFHASTLWYNRFAETDTNYWRGEFLRVAKREGLNIEGGLFYIGDSPDILRECPTYPNYKREYKEFIFNKRISPDEYIRKTKQSVLVFNTPSVCECHGWKLGEYLCMGKAIISTPLTRELPAPLVNGRDILFVNNIDELHSAIRRIISNEQFRHHLEKGARAYYEKWLAPDVVVKRICDIKI